jgi:hypothetical protein
MNELQQHRLRKQYEAYYSLYNKTVRPMEDKAPERTVSGVISWNEADIKPVLKAIK